jgi:proton-translocating NADH-quinone oxidoreductase chain L
MNSDPNLVRFMSLLSLFTFYMNILVCADNFLVLFFGWEGVGLCSFLLISFWYTRLLAVRAAIKAFIINKIGDSFFLLGLLIIFHIYRTLDFAIIFSLTPYLVNKYFLFCGFNCLIIDTICFFLFIGVMTKSAQLGLHTWLPDAMEGPTPVSALIHAATMVTAGVFLLIKFCFIFLFYPNMLCVITIIGALTAFFGATVGVVQYDIKKVIAYSTCSQLGYMIFACGTSNYTGALYHLGTHAFFKSLLFLSAGAIIYSFSNEQDIRRMGAFYYILPFTYTMFLIGTLALIGFPFLSGFYSKDVILEFSFVKYTVSSLFSYWLGSISTIFTSFYSFRLLYFVFFGTYRGSKKARSLIKEIPYIMCIPLIFLSFGSIFLGYLLSDIFIGLGSCFFSDSIFILNENQLMVETKFLPFYIKIIPTVFTFIGFFFLFILIYTTNHFHILQDNQKLLLIKLPLYFKTSRVIMLFLMNAWYFDMFYNFLFFKFINNTTNNIFYIVDKGFLEVFGSYKASGSIFKLASVFSSGKFTRSLGTFFFIFLFSFIILVIYFIAL